MKATTSSHVLVLAFLALITAVPVVQTIGEARRGDRPGAMVFFTRWPTAENLRAGERMLQDDCLVARHLLPWLRVVRWIALNDAGPKALPGRDGWLFYAPGVDALTQRPKPEHCSPRDAIAAVTAFRDALRARGIRLVVVPVPNKEIVYPERIARPAAPAVPWIGDDAREFLADCAAASVETVDLFALFQDERAGAAEPLYLKQDSHWSPRGAELAARAVAARLLRDGDLARGTAEYETSPVSLGRHGDLVRMMQSPPLEAWIAPERVVARRVSRRAPGEESAAAVLVLGDSFLRIFEQDEPGGAGFLSHLARELAQPVASSVNDGGASTLVRQELFRRPRVLDNIKVVIWEFTERDLRLGTEGWQIIPLPPRADGRE